MDDQLFNTLRSAHKASGQLIAGVPAADIAGDDMENLGLVVKALAQPRQHTDPLLEQTRSSDPIIKARAKAVLKEYAELLAAQDRGALFKLRRNTSFVGGTFFR